MHARARLVGILLGTLTAGLLATLPSTTASASTSYDLRVGSFNIRSVQFDTNRVAYEQPWKQRRDKVVRDILGEGVDVLGLQEASQNVVYASHYVNGAGTVGGQKVQTQYFDVLNGLNDGTTGRPWALTNKYLYNCVRLDSNYKCVAKYRGASRSTRILYRTDRLTMKSQGSFEYRHQTGAANDERYFVWAVFQIKATGKQFFFATTQLSDSDVARIKAQWTEVISQIKARRGSLPVVMTGDFQTTKYDKPGDSMIGAMRTAGFGDVVNQRYGTVHLPSQRAAVMVNTWINTMNRFRRDVRQYSYDQNHTFIGNNIDWVFATNALPVKRWKVVIHYDPKTMKLTGVTPSDHNMVSSVISMP
jgi:endonuclease/exonuclease/phosphatase family metal-dependent hydrolase